MNARTIEECVTAVVENRVRGFAYDAAILEYFASQYPGQFTVCLLGERATVYRLTSERYSICHACLSPGVEAHPIRNPLSR